MEKSIYELAKEFRKKYPLTIAWRLKEHAKVVEEHLNPGEKIIYVFAAQKNDNPLDIISTYVCVLTNRRLMLGHKRMIGYFFTAITPDLFNDLKVNMGFVWGKIYIDTIKELVPLSNIQKEALNEIETNVTEYMMEEKKKYTIQSHSEISN